MDDVKNDALRYLDAPLPIQSKDAVKTKAVIDFVAE